DFLADNVGIALESAGPEPVRQHRGAVRLRSVITRTEQSSLDCLEAHDLEVRAADDSGAHRAGVTQANHREPDGGEVAERGERLHAGAQVSDLGYREVR